MKESGDEIMNGEFGPGPSEEEATFTDAGLGTPHDPETPGPELVLKGTLAPDRTPRLKSTVQNIETTPTTSEAVDNRSEKTGELGLGDVLIQRDTGVRYVVTKFLDAGEDKVRLEPEAASPGNPGVTKFTAALQDQLNTPGEAWSRA
jgi:hypothetical protein